MVALAREAGVVREEEEEGVGRGVEVEGGNGGKGGGAEVKEGKPVLRLRPGYMYREANWEIGRAAERARVKVRAYKPGDRFAAWRKTVARKARNAERKGLRRK